MQLGNIRQLLVLPLVMGLIISSPGQASLAKSGHKKHRHSQCHGVAKEHNIVSTLYCEGSFKNLTSALKAAGLTRTLEGKGPFTLFAPDDKAFWKQRKGFMDDLKQDPKKLKEVLTYHVLPRKLTASELENMRAAKTVQGEAVMLASKAGNLVVDGAIVTKADIKCNNGVIHVIDDVLAPARGK